MFPHFNFNFFFVEMTHLDFPPVKFAELKQLHTDTHIHQIEDGILYIFDIRTK